MNPPNTTPLNEEDRLGEILTAVFNEGMAYQVSSLKDYKDLNFMSVKTAKQELTKLIQTLEKKAVENARSKDPFKCEFGHQVYSHNTADGWCCACDADIAFLNRQITQLQGVENETK